MISYKTDPGLMCRSISHNTQFRFELSPCPRTHYSNSLPFDQPELLLPDRHHTTSRLTFNWMTQSQDSPSSTSSSDETSAPNPGLADDLQAIISSPRDAVRYFFPDEDTQALTIQPTISTMTTSTMTTDQFEELLKRIAKTSNPKLTLTTPRLGGKNLAGVWTGFGAGELGKEPASSNCMRAFETDVLKNHQAISPIETKCKEGLSNSPDLMFCMLNEPNAKLIVYSLHAFEDLMSKYGMDGIFTIVKSDATTVNMLREPGMITTDIVATWCRDLLSDGVWAKQTDGTISRLAVCEYDRTNMIWSGEALLSSCSVLLNTDLKLTVPASERNGPQLLMALLSKLYRPSQSKIRALKVLLEAMDITKYPGENITLFVQDAVKLIREIRMNYMKGCDVPDLTTSALTGLTLCTDPLVLQKVRQKRMDSDVNGFDGSPGNSNDDPIVVLQDLERTYTVLCNQEDYGPAKSTKRKIPSLEAMVGELMDAKLAQTREAKSTTGNSGTNGGGQKGVCHACGSPDHYKGSPDCPKKSENGGTNGSGWGNVKDKHGLDEATFHKVQEACVTKIATMPARENIADSDKFQITIGGVDLAKYCRHCGRFTKGRGAHHTSEHKGTRNRFEYKGPPSAAAPAPAPAPAANPQTAGGNLAITSPPGSPHVSFNLSEVPQISTEEFTQGRSDVNYELLGRVGPNLAEALENDDPEGFYECLLNGYGG